MIFLFDIIWGFNSPLGIQHAYFNEFLIGWSTPEKPLDKVKPWLAVLWMVMSSTKNMIVWKKSTMKHCLMGLMIRFRLFGLMVYQSLIVIH